MQLQFLYGEDLKTKSVPIKPGTIYLDITTGELYYDDPSKTNIKDHHKIIDTATLIYTIIGDSVTFPSKGDEENKVPGGGSTLPDSGELSGSTTAKLGVAVLGSMLLGAT